MSNSITLDKVGAYSATSTSAKTEKSDDSSNKTGSVFSNTDYSKQYESIMNDFNSAKGESSTLNQTGDATQVTSNTGTKATKEQITQLRQAYNQVQDQQGWVGKAWDGIKNFFGHDNGSNAVNETIDKAAAGEITYEEAVEKLNTYASKQSSITDTFSNIASGLAVAAGVLAAPFSFGTSLAIGAGVGAAIKVGVKATDAATNNVQGDYGVTDVLKDAVTGGVNGLVTAATAGIGSAGTVVKEGGKVMIGQTIKQGVLAGAKAGAIDGAVMNATNYTADAVFDGKEFSFGGLVSSGVSGAVTGAAVGGIAGGVTSGFSAVKSARANVPSAAGESTTAAAATADDELLGELVDETGVASTVVKESTEEASEKVVKEAAEETVEKVSKDSVEETVEETGKKTFGQMVSGAKDNFVGLFKKGVALRDMSPSDIRKALTGKVNASFDELKNAYNQAKGTDLYKTNTAFRNFLEDAFVTCNNEQQ